VIVPHLYNGRDKTFYFLSYEGLRLPQQLNVIQSVPTAALRAGNLSAYSTQINNASGVPYLNNQIPTSDISPVSAKALAMYYPLPNYGAAGAMTGNYQQNFSTPISSDQGDVRIDRNITSRQTVYVRYSYKQRSVVTPPTSSASNSGSALVGISPAASHPSPFLPQLRLASRRRLFPYPKTTSHRASASHGGHCITTKR